MRATVKAKSDKNNSVLLVDETGNEKWFTLAEHVKMQYVEIGEASVTVDLQNDVINYIKMEKSSPKKPFPQKTYPKPNESYQEDNRQKIISRQACLNSAIAFYKMNNERLLSQGLKLQGITDTEIIQLAKTFEEFVWA